MSLHDDDGLDPPRHPNPSRISGWTPEQIAARRHFVEVVAAALCNIAAGLFTFLGIYIIVLRGSFVGWLLICLAAVFAVLALAIGNELEEGDR